MSSRLYLCRVFCAWTSTKINRNFVVNLNLVTLIPIQGQKELLSVGHHRLQMLANAHAMSGL